MDEDEDEDDHTLTGHSSGSFDKFFFGDFCTNNTCTTLGIPFQGPCSNPCLSPTQQHRSNWDLHVHAKQNQVHQSPVVEWHSWKFPLEHPTLFQRNVGHKDPELHTWNHRSYLNSKRQIVFERTNKKEKNITCT